MVVVTKRASPQLQDTTVRSHTMSTLGADESGEGIVSETQMYQLVRQRGAVAELGFEITFLDPGARAYVVSFGEQREQHRDPPRVGPQRLTGCDAAGLAPSSGWGRCGPPSRIPL
jgi:hypothetical protein